MWRLQQQFTDFVYISRPTPTNLPLPLSLPPTSLLGPWELHPGAHPHPASAKVPRRVVLFLLRLHGGAKILLFSGSNAYRYTDWEPLRDKPKTKLSIAGTQTPGPLAAPQFFLSMLHAEKINGRLNFFVYMKKKQTGSSLWMRLCRIIITHYEGIPHIPLIGWFVIPLRKFTLNSQRLVTKLEPSHCPISRVTQLIVNRAVVYRVVMSRSTAYSIAPHYDDDAILICHWKRVHSRVFIHAVCIFSGKIKIQDILACGFLDDLLEVRSTI